VPCQLCNDAYIEAVRRVCATEKILHIDLATLHMGQHIGIQNVELVRGHRRVVFPPNLVFHTGCANDKFVLWRPARVFASCDKESAALAFYTFAFGDCGGLKFGF